MDHLDGERGVEVGAPRTEPSGTLKTLSLEDGAKMEAAAKVTEEYRLGTGEKTMNEMS